QFFIVLPNANKENLNGQYPVVGEVTKGFAVIESITKVELGDNYKPVNDVVIENIQIHE
ncbi:TPA: peptidylprolyl isomerase, partial [Patescibacteria group bacterium]|nr:peptidylprolyl isomerase [Patescibacteria group bacterium]